VFAALLLDALDSRKNHQKEKEKNGGIGYKPIPVEEKRTWRKDLKKVWKFIFLGIFWIKN